MARSKRPVTATSKIATGIVHAELCYAVGCLAERVHAKLGPGLPKSVYHKALAHELDKAAIPFESNVPFEIRYDGVVCGQFEADFHVDGKFIVELEADEGLGGQHEARAQAHVNATDVQFVMLVNFGQRKLNVKHFLP